MKPFDVWLEEEYPNICMTCRGQGYMVFNVQFIKNGSITCPTCNGTGKKKLKEKLK